MRYTIKFLLLLFATSTVFFSACNKTELFEPAQTAVKDPTAQKILNFKAKLADASKSDETLTLDSAVWYIEAALNYSYCVTDDTTGFGEMTFERDSTFVVFDKTENIPFSDVVTAYSAIEQNLSDYANSAGFEQFLLVDIEFKDSKFKAAFDYLKSNSDKGFNTNFFPDLEYDWHPGAGGCYMGRCYGTHLEKSAVMIWSSYITFTKGALVNGYYTDIQRATYYSNAFPGTEMDTMLYRSYSHTSQPPCVTSDSMHIYFQRGCSIANRYTPPSGWGVTKIRYYGSYGGYPGTTTSSLEVYKGKINTSPIYN